MCVFVGMVVCLGRVWKTLSQRCVGPTAVSLWCLCTTRGVAGVFVPFLRGAHWSLGIVSFERKRLEYFDSLQYGPPSGLPALLSGIAQSVS